MPGFSPPMKLKTNPEQSLKKCLKTYQLSHIFDDVVGWLDTGAFGPASLKKLFIDSFYIPDEHSTHTYFGDIDLSDPVSWGEEDPNLPMPSDQFFLDLSKAIKADEKRNAKRSSYEF